MNWLSGERSSWWKKEFFFLIMRQHGFMFRGQVFWNIAELGWQHAGASFGTCGGLVGIGGKS
jgi:hypothetical protein